jgi:plastocyanin
MTRSVKWLAAVLIIGGVGGVRSVALYRNSTAARPAPLAAPAPGPKPPEVRRIAIDGTRFTPAEMVVPLGSTVTWTNADPFPHNVDSTEGGFRSGDLAPSAVWSVELNKRGVYPYQCTLHPGMKGVLRVQ